MNPLSSLNARGGVNRSASRSSNYRVEKGTCLSTLPHEKNVRNHVEHYFGCIAIHERDSFFDNDKLWPHDKELAKRNKHIVAASIAGQFKRIAVLRKAIDADKPTVKKLQRLDALELPPPTGPPGPSLVENVTQSRRAWLASDEYKDGLQKLENWRTKQAEDGRKPDTQAPHVLGAQSNGNSTDLESFLEQIRQWQEPDSASVPDYVLEKDVNAYIAKFNLVDFGDKDSFRLEGCDFESTQPANQIKGHFPDQRIAFEYLLEDPDILSQQRTNSDGTKEKRPVDDIRYIHVPSNNMDWVERIIKKYYGETDSHLHDRDEWRERSKADMLLRPQFWRGQQHGGSGDHIIHARHMRPICEMVSSNPTMAEEVSKNVVLFTPYLHWETDRRREAMARTVDEMVDIFRLQRNREKHAETEDRRAERRGLDCTVLHRQLVPTNSGHLVQRHTSSFLRNRAAKADILPLSQFDNAVFGILGKNKSEVFKPDEYGRLLVSNKLGQYLLDAARLSEAMSNYRDKKMIGNYLFCEAPLHPRRTLDQAHFWSLKSTRARDRDQVVYRGTSARTAHEMGNPAMHHGCRDQLRKAPSGSASTTRRFPSLPHHLSCFGPDNGDEEATIEGAGGSASGSASRVANSTSEGRLDKEAQGCAHCRENTRKVSRIVMVDQLWMWILDENTIITCFPQRYGVHKNDQSGVHKSIRTRLKAARKGQFQSVYDVAVVILDECSSTFFDRTKTDENMPQVMDIFSEAIGNLTYKHTISFDRLWHWTNVAPGKYGSGARQDDLRSAHAGLLNINPEGKLQREIKDIMEELDIMLQLHRKQTEIVKRFNRIVQVILDPTLLSHSSNWMSGEELAEMPSVSMFSPRSSIIAFQGDRPQSDTRRLNSQRWFGILTSDLVSDMAIRGQELRSLRDYAESTARSVTDLLALKQQQASVVQAWQSVQQADETINQGRAIMVFTIITITFLPLSFMSSIFGMNNSEFGDTWSLGTQFRLMFSISVAVIFVAVLLAFSSLARSLLWAAWTLGTNRIILSMFIYQKWLDFRDTWSSERQYVRVMNKVNEMRMKVQIKRQQKLNKKVEDSARKRAAE